VVKKLVIHSVKPFFFIIAIVSIILLPMPVKAQPQIEVVSHTSYVDGEGHYNIVGEVHNVGNQALEYIGISATFYDNSDGEIGDSFAYTIMNRLLPDKKSPFRIVFLEKTLSPLVHHYSLNVNFIPNVDPTYLFSETIEIALHESLIDDLGYMHIIGGVENIGEIISYFEIVATGYDETGKVVEVGFASSDQSECSLPQTMPFEIIIGENVELINSYELAIVYARENYIVVPEFNSYLLTILTFSMISFILIKYKRKIIKKS
jgi:hypothetical protein